jgi:uncharacterized protein (TIGR02145 family)
MSGLANDESFKKGSASWWSSTAYDSIYTWHWGLYHGNAKVRFNPGHKASGFSVRCVKDR